MKKFNTTINGYEKQEVNDFVAEVTVEYENMLNKLKSRDSEIALLKEKLNHYKDIETTLQKSVLLADDSSKQIKQIAKDEAKAIVADAKRNASVIINDALLEAQQTELEADKLRRSLKIYKARIKQVIEEQLTIVDDVDHISRD